MNPITRFRIARSMAKLEKLLVEDGAARKGRTTIRMMDGVLERGHDIAVLRYQIARLQGTLVEVEDSGGFGDRLPSGVYCPVEPTKE